MIINTMRVIQHNHESAFSKIKSPTAKRRRALLVEQLAINYFSRQPTQYESQARNPPA
jgi:hypothetical protein